MYHGSKLSHLIKVSTALIGDLFYWRRKRKVELTPETNSVQDNILKAINTSICSFDLNPSNSLIECYKQNKITNLKFISTVAQEQDLATQSVGFLEQGSVFRKLGAIKSVSGRVTVKDSLFVDKYITFTGDALKVYPVAPGDTPEITLQPISITSDLDDKGSLINLTIPSKKVGESYSLFENKLFFKMLTACKSYTEIDGVEDVAGIFRACRYLADSGSNRLLIILPDTYTSMSDILKDEIALELKIEAVQFVFIPDFILFQTEVRAAVLDWGPDLTVVGVQKGTLISSLVEVNNQVAILQSLLNCGYAISGLTNACVCKYNNSQAD